MNQTLPTPPVLFLVFKRPTLTKLVFEEIRKAQPRQLFIGADGPRENNHDDADKVNEVREIVQNVDWDCEVKTFFQKKNVGSKLAESSAINYFFENVNAGIILEDDCLPNQFFFKFCAELLDRYHDDNRIMHISGNNFQFGRTIGNESYYFSNFNYAWGWATWKRAWAHYDVDMKNYPKFKDQKQIKNTFSSKRIQTYLTKIFDSVYANKVDCWDYQWSFSILSQNGLCICPNKNLVSNIGFGSSGQNCIDPNTAIANIKTHELTNMTHPNIILPNHEADIYAFNKCNPYPMCLVKLQKLIPPRFLPILKKLWNFTHFKF